MKYFFFLISMLKLKKNDKGNTMAEQTSDEKYLLQSVNNALAIIDVLCEHDNLGLAELASYMNLGKSTVFRLLYTLQHKGYVSKDRNSKYHLSFKFTRIGTIVTKRSQLIELVHPFLNELSSLSGETAHLVTWHSDTEIIFIDKVIGTATIRMESMVGFTRLAHMTATGKTLLAYSSPEVIQAYMNQATFPMQTPKSIPSCSELEHLIPQIRAQGYACDNEESETGLTCFAAPVLSMGQAIAAISISGPTSRMEENRDRYTNLVKDVALKIGKHLGY